MDPRLTRPQGRPGSTPRATPPLTQPVSPGSSRSLTNPTDSEVPVLNYPRRDYQYPRSPYPQERIEPGRSPLSGEDGCRNTMSPLGYGDNAQGKTPASPRSPRSSLNPRNSQLPPHPPHPPLGVVDHVAQLEENRAGDRPTFLSRILLQPPHENEDDMRRHPQGIHKPNPRVLEGKFVCINLPSIHHCQTLKEGISQEDPVRF